ncbi:uncharacterized protein LACBIDRAFT_327990 [Laccaria bicolor S238N-H82]|uniref:DNA 3'-5' helicase n=1 Tax=Laccaria bicolor (strain S238N-H82 / ATCC MYA-4686) TaxID=486041 RepID=B0DDG6_LACBS|nr:uncharacterized protein LACBIDRAFT_327990 [Laccaria bicolor S238N-H82]EDR07604.1 predicted protein [Laccaria bicolor S238N-H82]|eukprot:XP_001881996.1 predicted protein [Laccaria bicolor S238N-H82]
MSLFHPAIQPHVLIFVDNKKLAACIASHLDSCLPPTIQNKGIVVHYHSKMPEKYLKKAHDSFIREDGICRIMVATLAQSVGVDFPNVKIVCTVSLPSTTTDTLQCGDRAFHNSTEDALFVIFYEPWIEEISLDNFKNFDMTDLDRPRMTLKANSQLHERAPFYRVKICQEISCTRKGFANYLGDQSTDGMAYITLTA